MKRPVLSSAASGVLIAALLLAGLIAYNRVTVLTGEIREKFDGRKWAVPASVYARPLELFQGMTLRPEMFERELELSGYRLEEDVRSAGGYRRIEHGYRLITRPFTYPDGVEKSHEVSVRFSGSTVSAITAVGTGEPYPFLRLDPVRIGSFHPLEHEDRIVLARDEVPDMLAKTIVAVEDRNFFTHHGISLTAIGRALAANIKAGRTVQGGSTITQQLVKNFFLNRERTFTRKIQEAVMALILDYRYSKDEILTAYINEIFLGQDGARAIHGFALASQFYFRRDLHDLSPGQIATLVGMVKGPSSYDPRTHPEQCRARRQTVLDVMLAQEVIDRQTWESEKALPVTDVSPQRSGFNRFPSFLDLVRRQLREEYNESDLNGSGLKILTTLDPLAQLKVERYLDSSVKELVKTYGEEQLEGAVVVTDRDNGEITALSGGRKPIQSGFNRALDAKRPIGSLMKPAVYLTALANGYTLASPLFDAAVTLSAEGRKWQPENFDRQEHGRVPLYLALARSYNLATVRLGMDVGLENVVKTIEQLGYPEKILPYPSLLLGAVSMSPLEVAQMYQTISSGGFYQPLRSIRAVLDDQGTLLTRYGLEIEQRFKPEDIYLLNHALQRVMTEGTGSRLGLPEEFHAAGKTGTSDNLRDSWFAGYTGRNTAVVWLGRDDNSSTSLTGSSGALKVWGRIMTQLEPTVLEMAEPEGIIWKRIDTSTMQSTHLLNSESTRLPFAAGSQTAGQWSGSADRNPPAPIIDLDLDKIEQEARKVIKSLGDLFQ